MSEKPKVSIIVPVYNCAEFLEGTIESVKDQEEQDWELLLVDDCSTDGSRDIINKAAGEDPRIKPVLQPENAGAARARNRGLGEATGRYIAFLDGDDIWKPGRLSHELAYMREMKERGESCGFVFSGYEFADNRGRGLGTVVKVPDRLNYRQALCNTTIFTSTVLFDREIIPDRLIQMPLVKSEDTATWWQILREGHVAYGLDENLVLYRRSEGTLSSNKAEAIKRVWNLYRNVEKLSLPYSIYNFCLYALRAVLRRI